MPVLRVGVTLRVCRLAMQLLHLSWRVPACRLDTVSLNQVLDHIFGCLVAVAVDQNHVLTRSLSIVS
jgi:hypothetical protein